MNEHFYYHRQQQTVAECATVQGFGYWSGQDVRIEFRPAPANAGVTFVREDLNNFHRIPATAYNRDDVPRRTNIARYGVSVEMVEHVLAALNAHNIDNCEIWTNAAEMPGCDGSSIAFVEAIASVGVVQQHLKRPCLHIRHSVRVGDKECWVEAHPHPNPEQCGLNIRYSLDYGTESVIGQQNYEMSLAPDIFDSELATARTFVLESEANYLRSQGLGLRVSTSDLIVFGPNGPIDNQLRFGNECVRHKTLDVIGDLALAGCDIAGNIVAHKSGHFLNAELVKSLLIEHGVHTELARCA